MIYYDSNKNKIIYLHNKDVDFNFTTSNNITSRQISKECELVIKFYNSELDYFREWFYTQSILQDSLRCAVSEYKRDIFISDNRDMKLSNCFLLCIDTFDNYFQVTLRCDYYHIDGEYPELKAIHRDIKIDLILSK